MTMHILPAFYTTTKTNRKSKQSTKLKASKLQHALWVASMTGGKKADKQYLAKQWRADYAESIAVDRSDYNSNGMAGGNCAKQEPKVYTGGNLVGIATMHKSNMVPIFAENKEAAADIAKMRR